MGHPAIDGKERFTSVRRHPGELAQQRHDSCTLGRSRYTWNLYRCIQASEEMGLGVVGNPRGNQIELLCE